jgi:hypothetical protein
MKKKIIITVQGCDDSTSITLDLDIHEYRLISRIAELITATSTYSCMPTMNVEEVN